MKSGHVKKLAHEVLPLISLDLTGSQVHLDIGIIESAVCDTDFIGETARISLKFCPSALCWLNEDIGKNSSIAPSKIGC